VNLNNSDIKFSEGGYSLKYKAKKIVFTSDKVNANAKECTCMWSELLAETHGCDKNFYKPLLDQLKRLVVCNKQLC